MFNLNADETQIQLLRKPLQMDVATAVERIKGRVAEKRMSSNVLKLNDDKTEFIIVGSAQPLKKKKKRSSCTKSSYTQYTSAIV